MEAAQEHAFRGSCSDPCVFFPLAAFEGVAENSRQGFTRKNPAPHQGSAWSNSARALGIAGTLVETRVRSRYTGKERDAESGLDDFEARYYSSGLGRFMRPDPQNAGASPEEPQSWNAYAYAGNNPLNNTDPDGLNYLVCEANGKNCADLNQKQYDEYLSSLKGTNTTVDSTGLIQNQNPNGSFTTIGQATYYDEKNADAAAHIAGSQLVINEFVKQVAINVTIGAIGRGIGLGIEAIQAARAANAATEAAEVANLVAKAAGTVGNQGATASSKAAALAAAEDWVGQGARPIVDRATGQVVGKISANGDKIYRITSINKAQPYVNLVNKTTGGNLHVRF
jgi:RHS repeat-associated protein